MITTFIILAITIVLFVVGRIRSDVVALMALLALYLTGILTTQQALAGFSDATVILIAALVIVGEGLSRTGVTMWLGNQLLRAAGGSPKRLLIYMMLGAAGLSAFIRFKQYLGIQLIMFVFGIVGPSLLIKFFAVQSDPNVKWAYWFGLFITYADIMLALAITKGSLSNDD